MEGVGATETDVVVIGGGPAGLATSIALSMKGLRSVVIDGCQPPHDKCCGEGLLPNAMHTLATLGVVLSQEHSAPLRGIRFVCTDTSADAEFPGAFGLGIRRPLLHQALIDRARQRGITLLWGDPASIVDSNTVAVGECEIRCRWIVGCDGSRSTIRTWAALEGGDQRRVRYGFRRHFRRPPWNDFVEVHWGLRTQAYVTPVSREEVCVAVLSRDHSLRLDDAMPLFPELRERLQECDSCSMERGAVTANQRFWDVCRGNVVLAGDASGTVDAITGSGLELAFEEALLLADAIEAGQLESYANEHRNMMRRAAWKSRMLLLMDSWPALAPRAIRTFSGRPELFRRMLAMHVSELNPIEQFFVNAELGWRILTG